MTYRQALKQSIVKRITGFIIFIFGIVSTSISLLRMLYFNFNDSTTFGNALSNIFQKLVYIIYENTQFLSIFWKNCPTPNLSQLNNQENIYFLFLYLSIFIGVALYTSGKKLAIRLKIINKSIENQLIHESIKGDRARTRQEIEETIPVERSSLFTQVHQLYLAPLVVAIISGILLKIL